MTDAIVVGAGPNGLAAAIRMAQAGLQTELWEATDRIGGGTHTAELTVPGVLHDVCSAAHPIGAVSPFFTSLALESHGLQWCHAPVAFAHPLDGGRVGLVHRSITRTADLLGEDRAGWLRAFRRSSDEFAMLADELLRPIIHLPRHPLRLARFGVGAMLPMTWYARRFATDEARALFAGAAAHVIHPLTAPMTASLGMLFVSAAHAVGWPVAKGGSTSITDALASVFLSLGGTIHTGRRVDALEETDRASIRLFDVSPTEMVRIAGDRLPNATRRAYLHFRHGPGVFKVDLAVEGGIPWTAPEVGEAGTVHLGGDLEETVVGEAEIQRGRLPERPFVLVGQQYVADPTRSNGDIHPIWAYAHVPSGFDGDATEAIVDQIERFAPGFRERVVARVSSGPAKLQAANANYVGGDIAGGANSPRQLIFRPRVSLDPYATGIAGVYLCSASTPPGGGVHGMCGVNAADAALRALHRRP